MNSKEWDSESCSHSYTCTPCFSWNSLSASLFSFCCMMLIAITLILSSTQCSLSASDFFEFDLKNYFNNYRPRSREIIRLVASVWSFCLSVCLCSPIWTVWHLTLMTHGIQSKISVCLSVIMKRSLSKSCAQQLSAFNYCYPMLKI